MLSDERIEPARKALSGQTQTFRSALATTIEQVRSFLNAHRSADDGKVERIAAELGPFASDRIDAERFSALFTSTLKLDGLTLEVIEKALETLNELAARHDDLFVVDVAAGGSLPDTVAAALEEVGRAFGAARVFELSKLGRFPNNEHARSLGSFPFGRWSTGERRLAPPLVVTVDGSDLRAEGLAQFMDGAQKIVLVVRGESAPAPLVRLVTPGTLVLQTTEAADLDRLAAWEGPGVGALVPESAARFVHNPMAGSEPWDRLTINHLPENRRRRPVGGVSVAQQAEELRQLTALSVGPLGAMVAAAGPAAPAAQPAPTDPVDKLAAWLLSQADLKDLT